MSRPIDVPSRGANLPVNPHVDLDVYQEVR